MKQKIVCYPISKLKEISNSGYNKAISWVQEGFELEWMLCDDYFLDPTEEEATLWKKRMLKAGVTPLRIQEIFAPYQKGNCLFQYKIHTFSSVEYASGAVNFDLTNYVPSELMFAVIDLNPKVWKYADYDIVYSGGRRDSSQTLIAVYCNCDLDDLTNYEKELCSKYLPSDDKDGEISTDSDTTKFLGQCDETLNDRMFTSLHKAYEWMLSEEYAIDHADANEYLFTEDGKPVHDQIGVEYVEYKPKSKVSRKTLEKKIRTVTGNDCLRILGTSKREADKSLGMYQNYFISDGRFDPEQSREGFSGYSKFQNRSFESLSELEAWFKELPINSPIFSDLQTFGMKFFKFVVSWSDGNDGSHIDFVVMAKDKNSAHEKIWNHYKSAYPKHEEHFSDPPCIFLDNECECEDGTCECECESYTIPFDPKAEFDTYKEAYDSRDTWHSYEELV